MNSTTSRVAFTTQAASIVHKTQLYTVYQLSERVYSVVSVRSPFVHSWRRQQDNGIELQHGSGHQPGERGREGTFLGDLCAPNYAFLQ